MHTHRVHIDTSAWNLKFAVQQAAPFRATDRDVNIFKFDDGEFGHHRVAVVTFVVHGVASISKFRPDVVSQKFVMRRFGEIFKLSAMPGMAAGNLLQKHHVSTNAANSLTQFGQDELAVEKREAFVDIDGQHLE